MPSMRRVDLNLIYVFQVIYTVKNLTRASEILCITQPAASNALKRLRALFNDPLFIRAQGGMEPTLKARAIAGELQKGLITLANCIEGAQSFTPSTSDICYKIITSDIIESMTLPTILNKSMQIAPNVTFEVYHCNRSEIPQKLASGRADIAFDSIPPNDSQLIFNKLFSDRYVCILNKNHQHSNSRLSLEEYISSDHVHAFSKMRSFEFADIDLALQKINLIRKIEMRTQHHLTVPYIVANTHLVGSVPLKSISLFIQKNSANLITVKELPFEVPQIDIYYFWHKSAELDSANCWLRSSLNNFFCSAEGIETATV